MSDLKRDNSYTTNFFKSDTDQSVLLKDLMTDNIVTAIINMGAEMWTTRRRLMTIEQLLTENGAVTTEMIEKYNPPPEITASWEQERDEFIARIYDVLARRGDVPIDAKLNY
ncbi:MAG: hypothetical protein P8L79_00305 [Rhodospirillaceae bacterium]|nr:hypothetical protein [Rhodospirillaceae bacterium]